VGWLADGFVQAGRLASRAAAARACQEAAAALVDWFVGRCSCGESFAAGDACVGDRNTGAGRSGCGALLKPGGGPARGTRRVGGGIWLAAGPGVLVTYGRKSSKSAADAAALAALAYAWLGDAGAETSARERRGRPIPEMERALKEWRRAAGRSRLLQGWAARSLARSAVSARASEVLEVRNLFMAGTLASSWIKKTVLNIENK
jgi:hypothetical protein